MSTFNDPVAGMAAAARRGLTFVRAVAVAVSGGVAFADGGVTFSNVSGSTGITYERVPSPARDADLQAIYAAGLPFPPGITFQIQGEAPQKPRGTPGVVVFDYDNDGDQDIYVTNGPGRAHSLYQNQLKPLGSLSFIDTAALAGVEATAQDGSGVCYGDIDNDGDEDLYVTGLGEPNILYRNNGNGTFTDITSTAGVGAGTFNHSGCALADFNGDGLLDILVGNTYDDWLRRRQSFLPEWSPVQPNQLFMRRADLSGIVYEDVSETSGIRDLGPWANIDGASLTWTVAALDIDLDGDVDIQWGDVNGPAPAVSPQDDRGWIRTLRNDGTGRFTDVTQAVGTDKTGFWMGLAHGDFNCDGALDIFSTNTGDYVGGAGNRARHFLADGFGGFVDPGIGPHLQATVFGWGAATLDYDNDGDQDVFYYGGENFTNLMLMDNKGTVLQNDGCRAEFRYDTAALLTDHRRRQVNGVAQGDINDDGFQDVVTAAMLRIVPAPGRLFLIANVITGPLDPVLDPLAQVLLVMARTAADLTRLVVLPGLVVPNGDLAVEINSGGNGNGWVKFETLGTKGLTTLGKANRDGIGAVLRFTPAGGLSTMAPVMGGGGHASQGSRVVHFGLGTAATGTVEVTWPGGVKNVLYDVAGAETLTLPEIPCDYDPTAWSNFGQFNSCVARSLNEMRRAGVITEQQGERLHASAQRFFGR